MEFAKPSSRRANELLDELCAIPTCQKQLRRNNTSLHRENGAKICRQCFFALYQNRNQSIRICGMPSCENPLPRASSHNCEELRKQICPQCYIRIYRERTGKPGRAYKMYKNMLCANLMCRQLILDEKPQSVLHIGRICGSCHNLHKMYLENFLKPVPMSPVVQIRDTVVRSPTRKPFESGFTIEELLKPDSIN